MSANNYYNDHDPKAAQWLRELIRAGLIPAGDVDERSITEIQPHELTKYTQCHFFAGIAGWSLALQLARWPATRPVWTGSCPCQPFSNAGKQLGQADERHLWPAFFNLIRKCRPDVVFGEQVASAIGKGWLDGISADLESEDYACGATVLGAHSIGSPHIRQRLYWVADAISERLKGEHVSLWPEGSGGRGAETGPQIAGSCADGWLPVVHSCECDEDGNCPNCGLDYGNECACRLVQPEREGLERHAGNGDDGHESGRIDANQARPVAEAGRNSWSNSDLIPCADGKTRRIESGLAPLAHGVPARMVRLRGYGNAIVPQVAAAFIGAYLDALTR